MKKITYREISSPANTCNKYKDIPLTSSKAEAAPYKRAVAAYSVIEEMLDMPVQDISWYSDNVRKAMDETIVFPTAETRENYISEIAFNLMRYHKYLYEELTKKGVKLTGKLPTADVTREDIEITEISPSFIYEIEKELHVVKVSLGKPVTLAKAKGPLFALLQYGRVMIPEKESRKVVAELHYMRGKRDTMKSVASKFELKTNIISTSREYSNPEISVCDEDKKDIEFFTTKRECNESECALCPNKLICGYKRAPLSTPLPASTKTLGEMDLTEAQLDVINFTDGVLKVNAGAGTGKTVTVAGRAAMLLSAGIDPTSLLLITFTEAGAREMRERVALYNTDFGVDIDPETLKIMTFNAFGQAVIDDKWEDLGFSKKPRLIDDVERASIVAKLLKDNPPIPGLDYKNFKMTRPAKGALTITIRCFDRIKAYDLVKGDNVKLAKALDNDTAYLANDSYDPIFDLYEQYAAILRDKCLIEYADQENLLKEVSMKDPYYFEDLGISHIIIDEFQDTSEKQMDFIKELMSCKAFKSLMVVGDDSQAIFGFRDTTPEYMIHFFEYLGVEGKEVFLMDNFRSTPEIVDFGNKIIEQNTERVIKTAKSGRKPGKPVVINGYWDKDEEYKSIVEGIMEHLAAGYSPEDICFIGATKAELMEMSDRLTKAGIPSIMLNPETLQENSRIEAALALLRYLQEPEAKKDALVYEVTRTKGLLLDKTDEEITSEINSMTLAEDFRGLSVEDKNKYFWELLDELNEDDEIYESFIESLKMRPSIDAVFDYAKDFTEYGQSMAVRRQNLYSGVVLTTAHSSKGLEWPIVYVSLSKFYNEPLHNKTRKRISAPEYEEKRRLVFVATTRAKDELYVSGRFYAFGSMKAGYVCNLPLMECYKILKGPKAFETDLSATKTRVEEAKLAKAFEKQLEKESKLEAKKPA